MKTVNNKTDLLQALKSHCNEIKIVGTYADNVFKQYSQVLNSKPMPAGIAIALIPKLGMSGYLEYYKIKSYKENELIITKM